MEERRAGSSIYGSAWRNCYWFARMLLNTDQYAAPGKNERAMKFLLSKIEPLLMVKTLTLEEKYKICRDVLMGELDRLAAGESKSAILRRNFRDDVYAMITSLVFVNMSRKILYMTVLMIDFCSCKCSCKILWDSLS